MVRQQPAISVYLNPDDEVVVRQEGQYDEDHWIYVTKDNALKVAQAILEAAGADCADGATPLLLSAPKDKTAAARMRRNRNKKRNGDRNVGVTEEPQLRCHCRVAPPSQRLWRRAVPRA